MAKEVKRSSRAGLISTLTRIPRGVALLFAVAGLASAYTGSEYSAWVAQLVAENSQSLRFKVCNQDCLAQKTPGVNCFGGCEKIAYEGWYRGNVALAKYADRQWWIWALSFPVAMTVALFAGLALNSLPNLQTRQLPVALLLLFFSSAVAAIVMIAAVGILWTLAPLPAAVAYAWLLTRTQKVLTAHPQSNHPVLPLLLAIPAGGVLGGILHLIISNFAWFSGVEVLWAVLFGGALAAPAGDEVAQFTADVS